MTSIAEWLESINLSQYAERFAEHEITLDVLPHLTPDDLNGLGLPIGPRRRLAVEIARLASEAKAQTAVAPAPSRSRYESGAHAERRQLTVMFCDLVGSTELAAGLDPEELRDVMQAYRAACTGAVARYEGHVAQYLGDGLMVYFGWPVAHEDDAERGVRAALEMVQAVSSLPTKKPLVVRIGLATGPVVVGDTRDDSTEAHLAIGETPNLAARLQSLAGLNEVVIAPTTRKLVANAFELAELGAHALKGIADPVPVWRVDATRRGRGRFSSAHRVIELAPLVGREEERELLDRSWQRARSGQGQVVLIGGQAGIGKSRLTLALRERIEGPHTALHYQCSPYHLNSPLHPVIEHLESTARFERDDSSSDRLVKLEHMLIGDANRIAETAPLFAALLSLPMDRYPALHLSPRKQKEKTLEALTGQIEELARQTPVLMIVEDVHWVDPTSQELLELLVERLRSVPVMLVMTHRPEYEPIWTGEPGVSTLTLSRLGKAEGAALVETITDGKALPAEVLDEILSRTDGVPLFVEELTRSVLESKLLRDAGDHFVLEGTLDALAIPVSLRDSLMGRLDRLGPAKEIAQIGACIGREFSYELLAPVSELPKDQLDDALRRLVDAGLVSNRDAGPNAMYIFKHALVQDAAYESLLKSRRSELHAVIARVLEERFADGVSKAPEWLAHHHTQAGHLETAIPLWRTAGTLAVARVALKEAIAHFQKGLALVEQLPASAERDRFELSIREPLNAAWTGLRGWAANEVYANANAILRLAESLKETRSLLLAKWWVWTSTITQGRIADSRQWVDRLLEDGHTVGDIDSQMFSHATAMVQHMLSGELTESREHTDRALSLYDPRLAQRWIQLTGHDLRTFVEVYACQLMWMLGYPEQAMRMSNATKAHAQADGHAFSLVWALTFSAYVFAYRREPARFLERVEEAERLAREQGLAFIYEVSVPQAKGIAALQNGRPKEAIDLLRHGIERWTATGGHVRVPYVKSALAEAVALNGDHAGGIALINECLEQIERPSGQERLWHAEVLRLKGWMLSRQGQADEAEATLLRSIAVAREQRAKSWELRSATTLAGLMARQGRHSPARELLLPVYQWFTEGFDTRDLIDARSQLDELGAP